MHLAISKFIRMLPLNALPCSQGNIAAFSLLTSVVVMLIFPLSLQY